MPQLMFSPFEDLYGLLFLYSELLLDMETSFLEAYVQTVAQFQTTLKEFGLWQKPSLDSATPLYPPGAQALIKVWKDGSPNSQLQPS